MMYTKIWLGIGLIAYAQAAAEFTNEDDLARLANMTKLVIIGSCVGVLQGLQGPDFECASFCKQFPKMRLEKVWLDSEYLTSGFLGVDEDLEQIVLMHRGTMSMKNLVLDLDTTQVDLNFTSGSHPCVDCRVHQGFWRGYNSSFNQIIPHLDALVRQYPRYQVLVGGHSMGGSVAMITAADLKHRGVQNLKLVTCGQPMVGNQAFANYLDSQFDFESETVAERELFILTRQYDPVPFYPVSDDYSSTSGEVFISRDFFGDKRYYTCDGQRDQDCSWGSRHAAVVGTLPYTHPDYGPGVYQGCVEF